MADSIVPVLITYLLSLPSGWTSRSRASRIRRCTSAPFRSLLGVAVWALIPIPAFTVFREEESASYVLHFCFGIDRLGSVSVLPWAFTLSSLSLRFCVGFGLVLRKYRCSLLVCRRFRWLFRSRNRGFCPFCFRSHCRQRVLALNHLLETNLSLLQHLLFTLLLNTSINEMQQSLLRSFRVVIREHVVVDEKIHLESR